MRSSTSAMSTGTALPESAASEVAIPATPLDSFLQCRPLLVSIAYRMLGSMADAEDMLQEAFLRWQQISHDDIQSPKAFLVTIVTRLCINHLQSARAQREQYVGEWLPEPMITVPTNDPSEAFQVDESLSLAFLVLLERLNPIERAVFLLREVFAYEYAEIAEVVGQNEVNCRQIFRRARVHVKKTQPRFDASAEGKERLLREFLEAVSRGDLNGLLRLFSDDITVHTDGGGKAAALMNPVFGPDKVARLVIGANLKFQPKNAIQRIVQVNGQPAMVSYLDGHAETVLAVDVVDQRIRQIYILRNPDKLASLPILAQ